MYVQLLDHLWQQCQTERLCYVVARSNGAEVDEPPGYDECIDRLDEALAAPFAWAEDDPNADVREALGLNGR